MRSCSSNRNRKSIELNMTSMIDVVFLLLIFFIFTTNFDREEKRLPMNLTLPGAIETKKVIPPELLALGEIRILVTVDQERLRWMVNQRPCSSLEEVETILAELSRQLPDIPVIIDPAREIPIENVLDLYDRSRKYGLKKIQFAVSPELLRKESR